MFKFFTILLCCVLIISCGTTSITSPDFDFLITTVPDQSKFGNYTAYELEIAGYNYDTKKYTHFTNDDYEDRDPSCSPSGDKILFSSKRPFTGYLSGQAPKNLFIINISTKDLQRINSKTLDELINESFIDFNNPVWSPVSNEIAFGMRYLDSSKLVVYNLDTEKIILSKNVPDIYKIRWSSDGTHIGYEGIRTTRIAEYSLSLLFELGFINLKNQNKVIMEQTDIFNWGLIGGIIENNNFMIYNLDSTRSQIKIFEYNVITDNKKYFTTTMNIVPEDCGPTADEILFIKTLENHSQDVRTFNFKTNSFKQLTFDGQSKEQIKYFNKK